MNIGAILYGALLAADVDFAEAYPPIGKSIALDQLQHVPQSEARIISEKAGTKYKPQIFVSEGCYSFPTVNAAGETTTKLRIGVIF